MTKKIFIAVNEDTRREKYLSILQDMDVEVSTVSSVGELCSAVKKGFEDSPCGIILDMPTKLEAGMEERMELSSTAFDYPACLVKLNEATGEMKVILSDEYYGEDKLGYFVRHQCRRSA